MSTPAIDYDALARQHGGSSQVDYDALASQHGGAAGESAQSSTPAQPWYRQAQASIDQQLSAPPVDPGWRGAIEQYGQKAAQTFLAPVLHPKQAVQGLADSLTAGPFNPAIAAQMESVANDYQQGGLPRVAENLAGQATGMALQGGVMGTGSAALSGARGAASTIADASGLMDGPAESVMTRALRGSVNKNNVNWNADVRQAIPLMKSAESQIGKPITNIGDALAAANAAKKSIWQQYQARLSNASGQSATIDVNPVADAIENSIDKRTALQNPELAAKIKQKADTYRGSMSADDAEDFLQSVNNELNSYYAKNKVGQRVAQGDPQTAYIVAEGNALRKALYDKLDDVTGPGSAQLKQAYGSLSNVQKVLADRQLVAARQAPQTLNEQIGFMRGAGKVAKSAFNMELGDAAEGVANMAGARWLAERNSTDAMLQRAFQKAQPAQAFQAPQFRQPLPVSRQLPQQSGAPTILPYSPQMTPGEQVAAVMQDLRRNPQYALPSQAGPGAPTILPRGGTGMTGGEQLAALMYYLRQHPQLALPAKASPLIPPPPIP